MKLYKALKLRKTLIGEISNLKEQIKEKNSYLDGSLNGANYNVQEQYELLLKKIGELTNLKIAINEANQEIQPKIFALAEYKALIAFWKEVSVLNGLQSIGYADTLREFKVHVNEQTRNQLVKEFQTKVDALQEDLDLYNYNTDIAFGD